LSRIKGEHYDTCIVPGGYSQKYGAYCFQWQYRLWRVILDCSDEHGDCEDCPIGVGCRKWWDKNIVNSRIDGGNGERDIGREGYNRLIGELGLIRLQASTLSQQLLASSPP